MLREPPSLVAAFFRDAMIVAEIPLGFFSLLHGRGAGDDEVGDALLRHPGFKTIYWIGSTDSAMRARTVALEHDKRFHFAGSGRNPLILFPGFADDIKENILDELAISITDPHGFGPYRPSRIFVQDSIYKQVVEGLGSRLAQLTVGDPLNAKTQVGPLPKREALRFEAQIKLALSETGRLVTGGDRRDSYAAPSLIRDLTNCSTLQSEELAGPWATIASFKYQHDALKYANTSPLGLAGAVLHPDRAKAEAVAKKLEASRIFLSARPPWPDAFSRDARPVKKSANSSDGVRAIFTHGQWVSTVFDESRTPFRAV